LYGGLTSSEYATTRLGHRCVEVVAGGVKMEVLLELDVEYAVDELPAEK